MIDAVGPVDQVDVGGPAPSVGEVVDLTPDPVGLAVVLDRAVGALELVRARLDAHDQVERIARRRDDRRLRATSQDWPGAPVDRPERARPRRARHGSARTSVASAPAGIAAGSSGHEDGRLAARAGPAAVTRVPRGISIGRALSRSRDEAQRRPRPRRAAGCATPMRRRNSTYSLSGTLVEPVDRRVGEVGEELEERPCPGRPARGPSSRGAAARTRSRASRSRAARRCGRRGSGSAAASDRLVDQVDRDRQLRAGARGADDGSRG